MANMSKAARAIIIEGKKILVMYRNKGGDEYFTLVGGQINKGESAEDAVKREVKEETGLDVLGAELMFIEEHSGKLNDQYIYLCQVASHDSVGVLEDSEEGLMNKVGVNIHKPVWVRISHFDKLPFRTMLLQRAIVEALKNGFPSRPIKLKDKKSQLIIRTEDYP
jgi:ADP-ribose pyrophosphatase YjhB (NUDIX family)